MRAERLRAVRGQQGFMLIEAMVAILIFSLGVLGLVALGGQAVSAQSDAQYRTEASGIADAIAGQIAVGVDRTNSGANIATSLAAFVHQPAGGNCVFSGTATANASLLTVLARAATMPGAGVFQQQVAVQNGAGTFNRVEITVCWKTASDSGAWRKNTYVTYVN